MKKHLLLLTILFSVTISGSAQNKKEKTPEKISESPDQIYMMPESAGPDQTLVDCLTCPSYDYSITALTSYQTHTSSIVSNGCRIYLLFVSENSTYTFKTGCGDGATADFDTYLELYNYACVYTTGNDDGCESNRSIITWTATYSGYAYLKVRGYNSSYFGNYTLAYKSDPWCISCPSYEYSIVPGNSYQTHNSSISCMGCRMYYMYVTSGNQYIFKTGCGDGATADFDTYIELYNSSCSMITADDDGCESNRSVINWTATYTGNAYLKVKAYSAYFGNYTLAYSGYDPNLCKTCPSYDFAVTPYSYYQTHSSSIQSDGCKIYAVNVTSGRQYTFKTGCGDGATANFDTYLELYDSGCSILATDDDGCESNRSQIVWNATYTGTIYFKARGFNSGAYGSYTLAYIEVKLPNIWLGTYNYQWENPVNWSLGHVPAADEEVIIAPYGYQPCILAISNQECYSLEIQSGASLVIDSKQLKVNWDVAIYGNLSMSNAGVLRVALDWWRNTTTGSFSPGNGRVVFESPYYTNLYTDETFYILEISKSEASGLVWVDGCDITCQIYDWTQGGLNVVNGGSFTTWDLADNGLFGTWGINNTGGTINACNFDGYVDLNGSLFLTGGTMNVYGGTTYSYWPYQANAEIYMTDGILDFRDQGICIYNSPTYALTNDITGGFIRTSKGFIGQRGDFTPTLGVFEFYGTSDYNIIQANGCTLNHVYINKGAKEGDKTSPAGSLIDERSGMVISGGGKSNSISLGSDFTINDDLIIGTGSTFDLNGFDCMVNESVENHGILSITQPADLSAAWIFWEDGSDDNITDGTIHVDHWIFKNGALANIGTGNTAYVTTMIQTANQENAFGNLVMDILSKENMPGSSKGAYDLIVNGDLTVAAGSWTCGMDVDVAGNLLIQPGASLGFSQDNRDLKVSGDAEIAGSLILPYVNNSAMIYDDLTLLPTGSLQVNSAYLQCNGNGNFALNGSILLNPTGTIYFPQSSNIIGSTFNDDGITGGTLQFGGHLIATTPGTFQLNSTLLHFTGEVENRYINLSAGNWLDDVFMSGSGFPQKLENDLLIKGNLDFSFATFNLNGKTLTVDGDINLSSGKLAMQPGSKLDLGNGIIVSQDGTFESLGIAGNTAHVYKGTSGNYSFNVQDNGHIKSAYTLFEGMNASGIHILSSGIIDPSYPFSNCTFSNGAAAGALLTIENTQSLVVQSPVFPANTWSGLYNITKTSNSGIVEVNSATGSFAGPDFENDPYERVNWTGGMAGLWTGNVSSDWFTMGNWSSFTIPDAVVSVLIPPGCTNYPVLNGAQGNCYNLTVDPGANLTIGNNKILAVNFVYISGNLTMTEALGCLQAEAIYFQAGSTDNVNYGEIRTDYFEFSENTLAKFSGLNTVYCAWTNCYDPSAEFANLNIVPYSKKGNWINGSKTSYPIRVTGDFGMEPGSYFTPYSGIFVNGNTEIQNGAILGDYSGPELDLTCNGNFTMAGNMRMYYSSEVMVHGNLNLTGYLTIFPDCEFTCDYNSASGWATLNGTLDLYPGSDFNITGANVLIGPLFNLIEQAPYPPYFNAGMTFGRSLSAPSANFQVDYIYTSFTGSNTGHYIDMNASNYLLGFAVNKYPGGDYYLQSNLTVKDFIYISVATTLQAFDKTLTVGGDWTEDAYWAPAGDFEPMTGRVIFNGSADQTIIGQAELNILEVNKPAGRIIIPAGSSAECQSYDYTAGGIRVDGGTFTAIDIIDARFNGNNELNSGTLSISQDALQTLGLSGNLTISGGVMNVASANGSFYWGFYENCHVAMNNGEMVVNAPEGLAIPGNYSGVFSENITGGTIKVYNELDVLNTAFTPTGGTIEFVGPGTTIVGMNASSNVFNLLINKTGTDDSGLIAEYQNENASKDGGKANEVRLYSDLQVNGTLTVAKGLLDLNGYDLRVSQSAMVNNGGTLEVDAGAALLMAANQTLAVTEGGTLNVIGSAGYEARISQISTGNYTFNIDAGGTIGAQYGIIEYTGTNGLYLKSGSHVNPVYPFHYCTFQNGASGGRLITISNTETFTSNGTIFPANTWSGSYNVYKNSTSGTVNFLGATGGFAGAAFEYDPYNLVNWTTLAQTFYLKGYLEGAFNPVSGTMRTDMNTLLPLGHPYHPALPYFGNPMPDWYYAGNESVMSIPNSNLVDWVIIQLREGSSPATATAILATQAAFINNAGNIVGLDGFSPLNFTVTYSLNLYAVIWHRNHLGIISANPLVNVGGTFTYDFSSGSGQAFGGTAVQKELSPGIWGMIAGDGDGNGMIQTEDKTNVWNLQTAKIGYFPSDYNMNKQVNNPDKNDFWKTNLGRSSILPGLFSY